MRAAVLSAEKLLTHSPYPCALIDVSSRHLALETPRRFPTSRAAVAPRCAGLGDAHEVEDKSASISRRRSFSAPVSTAFSA